MILKPLQKIKHYLFFSYLELKRVYRKFRKKPIIHVFGDSHSLLFQHELFKMHHVGPATAYKLNFKNSSTKGRDKIYKDIKRLGQNNSYLLFVFGEIDCRIHINKASNILDISLKEAIKYTINSYINFLNEIKKDFPDRTILVLNVLPSGEQENIYKVKYYPSRSLQLKIVKIFNRKLNDFCSKQGFIFISVFDELIDKNDNRIKEYIFDDVHYNKKILPFIIKEIKKKITV